MVAAYSEHVELRTAIEMLKKTFPGIYNINSLIEELGKLNISLKNTDSIVTGNVI